MREEKIRKEKSRNKPQTLDTHKSHKHKKILFQEKEIFSIIFKIEDQIIMRNKTNDLTTLLTSYLN